MATMNADEGPRAEWRRNWTVVLAGAVGMGLLSVPTYSIGIFMKPLEDEFGWSRAAISAGSLFSAVAGLGMGFVVGSAVDRFGPRRIAMAGSILLCVMIGMLSTAGPSIRSWWVLWATLALCGMLIRPMVWTAAVSSLFSAGRGLALAVTLCGTALASTFTPVLGNYLIDHYGWRLAFVGVAAIWAVGALPIIFFLFDSAHDRRRKGAAAAKVSGSSAIAPALPGVSPRDGLLSWRFARMALAALIATAVTASFVPMLVPILSFTGQPRATAATIAGMTGLSTIVGRLLSGYLADRMSANVIGGVTLLLPIASCLLLVMLPGSLPAAGCAALLLGLALGAKLHFVAYLTTRHFGMRSFGTLFGVISGLFGFATGAGPPLVNYIYDVTGSYNLALMGAIPLLLLASVLFVTLGRYPDFEPIETDDARIGEASAGEMLAPT